MNLLTYIHLRNIYRSTGVGRVGRELTEHLAQRPELRLRILADRRDHDKIVHKVGLPWTRFDYSFFEADTSRQQLRWLLRGTPTAESYWPEAEIVYCTAESYVPTKKARLVVTSHDMQLFESQAHPMSRWLLQQRFKWWWMFRVLSRRAAMIHAISNFSAERLAHYFPALRDRIRVVPNAVSEVFFAPAAEEGVQVLRELHLLDRPYLLLPGGLHYRKNAPLVLQAWPELQRQLPELTLVVGGHNTPEFAARAEGMPGVVMTGFQEESTLVALYQHARAVWFPSRYEGFGMPLLEAMACGAPVVASNSSAVPETAGGAAAALVSPDKVHDHVEALAALLQDEGALSAAAERGRARAAEFTWTRSTERLVQEFTKLL